MAACFLALPLLPAGKAHSAENKSQGIVTPPTTDGAEIYRVTCSVCHGERGDGDSFAGKVLEPRPTDFTASEGRKTLTRSRMLHAVLNGRPRTAMQPYTSQLTARQIEAVVDYIRDAFMTAHVAGEASDRIALGRKVYNAHCYMCHGYGGDARTEAARALSPPPRDFTSPALRGVGPREMFAVVKNGRAGTSMKPFHGTLTDAEIEAVVAFIRYAFVEGEGGNIRYHSPQNGWVDFERKYSVASRYVLYDGDPAELPEALEAGRRTFEVACVTCHAPKERPPVRPGAFLWRSEPRED